MRACLFLLIGLLAAAEVRLELPQPAVPGAELNATLTIVDAASRVVRVVSPTVPGIAWGEPRSAGQQTTIINGEASSKQLIAIPFVASQQGTFTVPAFTVVLRDGAKLTTPPATLVVAPADTSLVGDAVADAWFEPATIVPGEPTTLVYRLRMRSEGAPIDATTPDSALGVQPPEGAIRLGDRQLESSRTVDAQGRAWSISLLRWPLTFTATGPVRVEGQQRYTTGPEDFFGRRSQSRSVAVKPAELTVRPLPNEGRPEDFTGLIGPASLTAVLDRNRISAGEGAQLTITVTGRQIELVRRPMLAAPAGVRLYPKDEASPANERRFIWDVVPERPGSVALPAVSVPYYDPQAKAYARAQAPGPTLEVLPGRSRELATVGGTMPTQTPTTTPAPTTGPSLPTPMRQAGGNPPGWGLAAIALAVGGVIGTGIALAGRLRPQRGPHRGRQLTSAIASRDAGAIAQALAAFPDEPRLAELRAVVDAARFGGAPLPPDLADRVRPWEGVA